ncbi:hypothetical protein [Chamaesiphon minutus]|uniref:Uncharacterized protein n=1 Tax=Chamaesiphon minutus (strain ATCC 27169 / PCC 6605) TaxID=1173020 RepID=K9UQI4_CHAP6|nr:hypothetical protein [Chamaesiphon minutus]AFY96943.1 hypothetical protein Cha6605_6107 [Chamaesiphon minutus PCC 6605]
MKRFALVGLSILCLSLAATTSVKAETRMETLAMSTATIVNNPVVKTRITPFALVSLAYQGEYRTQGIPGFGSFQSAVSNKKITAKDLVKAAIDANQLTPETQSDRAYLNALELQLSFADS